MTPIEEQTDESVVIEADEHLLENDEKVLDENVSYDDISKMNEDVRVGVESVSELVHLYHTVSQEGVSSYDIQAYNAIVERLNKIDATVLPVASLESYSGLWPAERMFINLSISQEGFLSTAIETVKRWIIKLGELVIKFSKWLNNLWRNDARNSERYFFAMEKAKDMYKEYMKWLAKNSLNNRYDQLSSKFRQVAESIINDPALPRNRLTAAAWGETYYMGKINDIDRTMRSIGTVINKNFDVIKKATKNNNFDENEVSAILENAVNDLVVNKQQIIRDTAIAQELTNLYPKSSDIPGWPGVNWIENWQVRLPKIEYIPYVYLDNGLFKFGNRLRTVQWKTTDLQSEQLEQITSYISNLSEIINQAQTMVGVVREYNTTRLKWVVSIINYYAKITAIIQKDYEEHILDDVTRHYLMKIDAIVKDFKKYYFVS